MNEDRFWEIIDSTLPASADRDEQYEMLFDQLSGMPAEQVAAFAWWFNRQLERSDCSAVEAAWGVIDGVGADDGYNDFRCWLISRGRSAFEKALRDPDSLADVVVPGEETHFWDFDCADSVYRQLTGEDCPEVPALQTVTKDRTAWDPNTDPNSRWRLPRLCRLFNGEE